MAGGTKRRKTAKRAPAAKSRTAAKRPATTRRTAKKPAASAKRRPTTQKAAPPAPPKTSRRATRRIAPDDTVARLAAQLAVIDSMQKALAARRDIQGIYDAVGDKIREIFHNVDTGIRIYDPETNLVHFPYTHENGSRIAIESMLLPEGGFGPHVLRTRETLVINEKMEEAIARYRSFTHPGTQTPKSAVYVPLVVGDRARGVINLMDMTRENAFSESDVRLLQTLANSMSVALENARLFDETQRLLKETEQRNAELGVINSIQQGLASKLELQAIIDLVGDKLREIFSADFTVIFLYDRATNLVSMPYVMDRGQRFSHPATPPRGISGQVLRTRSPVILRSREELERLMVETDSFNLFGGFSDDASAVYAPVIAGGEATGVIALGKWLTNAFSESDVNLITTVAASLSVALQNARSFEAERQRSAELAVINSIQEGMAAELNFQAIVDLVGDKLREVFKTGDIGIWSWDESARLAHPLYVFEHGVRLRQDPYPVTRGGAADRIVSRREVVVAGSRAEQDALGWELVPGTDQSHSIVGVPIVGGDRVIGSIQLENHDREHAFGESEVRLLTTVTASMGVALENARLFDETQRLFKESEQRAAELAIINSVQKGLAAELDFQAIIDLVGDKIAEIFHTGYIYMALHDRATNLITMPYYLEHGERFPVEPFPLGIGLTGEVIRTREPLLINENFKARAAALGAKQIGDAATADEGKSYLGVPILKGDAAFGVIGTYSQREHAFGESDVRLLQTLANSMGVALENARLFDETQRRGRETTALAEVGRDISATLDLGTVMDRIARHAKDLLHGDNSAIFLPDAGGRTYHAIVAIGAIAEAIKATEVEAGSGIIGSLLAAGRAEFINDTGADSRAVQIPGTDRQTNERLMVAPLLAGSTVKGAMAVWRTGGRPFDDTELEFLTGLSLQATVAIENARLFDETRQTLERQTATAEVLQVISGSMADPKPVFDKILDSCERLFGKAGFSVCLVDGGMLTLGAYHGDFPDEVRRTFPRPLAGTVSDMAIRQGSVLHRSSVLAATDMPDYIRELAKGMGDFSVANAPLTWDGRGIGTIDIVCSPARAFSEAELALLETFADQAVIAIQNARLFNETKEALEHQTATAEVLKVISGSPTDVQPVFDAIAERARTLCDAQTGGVTQFDGTLVHLRAFKGASRESEQQMLDLYPLKPGRGAVSTRAILERAPVQIADVLEDPEYTLKDASRAAGYRSTLAVPMLREGQVIGAIAVTRLEPGTFPEKLVALLQTFADQAVIAIENVRLFNETKEALERQTATADVLQAISSSVEDTAPVFEKILDSCERLFGTEHLGIVEVRGDGRVHPAAIRGSIVKMMTRTLPDAARQQHHRTGHPRAPHRADRRHRRHGRNQRLGARHRRCRRPLLGGWVPMLWEDRGIGSIMVVRQPPNPFSEKDEALLKTFADQAVIAVQNARLFNETREALERQTATSEVLRVISESPTDVQPVFDAIAERAMMLCRGNTGAVTLFDGELVHLRGYRAATPELEEKMRALYPVRPQRGTVTARAIAEGRPVQIPDMEADPDYTLKEVQRTIGNRSTLGVPMIREGRVIGSISVARREAGTSLPTRCRCCRPSPRRR